MRKLSLIYWMLILLNSFLPGESIRGIKCPDGYSRVDFPDGSYANWITSLLLKANNLVLSYNDSNVSDWYNILGVVDMPLLFKSDLEQCADWAMRFWAEYHKDMGKLDSLYLFKYSGEKLYYSESGLSFLKFIRQSMAYSNSYSLKIGCPEVDSTELMPGDILVQNETTGIGHVSVIMDICTNEEGEKLYLIGYSFMPAQEFHIEKAGQAYGIGGWFTLAGYVKYLKNNLDYGEPAFRRFGR